MSDPSGWNFWVGNNLNAGYSRDYLVNSLQGSQEYLNEQSSFQASNGRGCGWPSDPNGQFVTMLYYNALNRCPDSGGYQFWTGALAAGNSRAAVMTGFIYGAEFIRNHKQDIDAFLAAQSTAAPLANAEWFGAQPGGSTTVEVISNGLYRTDFYNSKVARRSARPRLTSVPDIGQAGIVRSNILR